MSQLDERQLDRAVLRVERAVDEAYSRHAGALERDRIDGMSEVLRQALAAEPEALRPLVLERMFEHCQQSTLVTEDSKLAKEVVALRAEVERLRQARETPVAIPAASGAVLRALLGTAAGEIASRNAVDEDRVAALVQALASFAADLARAFLGTADKSRELTPAEPLRETLDAELSGRRGAGSFAALLEQIKYKIGAQLEVFSRACEEGAQHILRELEPLVLEDQAREAEQSVLGYRPFHYREAWQVFQRRYEELVSSSDLYETYFDGPLRKALFKLRKQPDQTSTGHA